jgi:hypothetical protein
MKKQVRGDSGQAERRRSVRVKKMKSGAGIGYVIC